VPVVLHGYPGGIVEFACGAKGKNLNKLE